MKMKMIERKWVMGIKSMKNNSVESSPIFILKWKNIGKTFLLVFLLKKKKKRKDGLQELDLISGVDYVQGRFGT